MSLVHLPSHPVLMPVMDDSKTLKSIIVSTCKLWNVSASMDFEAAKVYPSHKVVQYRSNSSFLGKNASVYIFIQTEKTAH